MLRAVPIWRGANHMSLMLLDQAMGPPSSCSCRPSYTTPMNRVDCRATSSAAHPIRRAKAAVVDEGGVSEEQIF